MIPLDGFYQLGDTTVAWTEHSVTFTTDGDAGVAHVAWSDVEGARRTGGTPGRVQVLVRGQTPPAESSRDRFSVEVASEADANRLLTTFVWLSGPHSASA